MSTRKTGTPARRNSTNPVAEKTKIIGAQWQATTGDSRSEWNALNRSMQNPEDPAGPIGFTSGYTAFFTVLTNLMTVANPISTAAPSYDPPAPLPPIRVDITINNGVLAIRLIPNIAVPEGNSLVFWATRSVPTGNSTFGPKSWRKCAVMEGGIPLAGINVAAEYRSVFPMPLSSSKIGIKLQVITPAGLHSVPLATFGLTPVLSVSAAASGDTPAEEDLHLG